LTIAPSAGKFTPLATKVSPQTTAAQIPPRETALIEPSPAASITAAHGAGELPPQSRAAEIRPPELRQSLTLLSNLLGFQVQDRDGALLGTALDFVVNTCETYIIYIVLEPAASPPLPAVDRLAIPFEAVTANSGAIDAESRAIVLPLAADQLADAPAFTAPPELVPTGWESSLREYWKQRVRLGSLSTGCNVPASSGGTGTITIHKVAYATRLFGAPLQDALKNHLGTVREAVLEPESGKLGFFVVELIDENGLVLVPLAAVNIPDWALERGQQTTLVLLTENNVLLNAPRIDALEQASDVQKQSEARGYW
jgi:sporulation protein YlmC with PRC-barrel domain